MVVVGGGVGGREGWMDGAERWSNMEGDEWRCMPARRPPPDFRGMK